MLGHSPPPFELSVREAVFGKMKTYLPISCDFHSELELFALRQQPVEITYHQADGGLATICEAIRDLYARNGEEFLLLPDGNEIRLDQLVSVGGKFLSSYCTPEIFSGEN